MANDKIVEGRFDLIESRLNRLEKLIYIVLITSAPNVLAFIQTFV